MMEQERTFLNLRDLAIRISLNDFIPAQTYLDYRATAFFRAGVNYRFATNNPNFSDEERALLSQIDQNLQVYTSIDNGALPDQAKAHRLLPLLDSSVSLSHTLLNIRRDRTYDANRETFAYIDQLWHFLLVTVIALLAAVFAITIATQQIARKEREQAVAQYRYHLTQELHDAMNYHLAIVMHKLDRALRHLDRKPDITRTEINEAKTRAKLALDDTRSTIQALSRGNIQPLQQTIWELAPNDDRLSSRVTVAGSQYDLPDDVAFAAYRIAQEAFSNTVKHAPSATQITVTLTYQPRCFMLQISDNGNDASQLISRSNHYEIGLLGMRDRVEQLGGRLQFGPTGEGFRIYAEIPTEMHDAAHSRVDR